MRASPDNSNVNEPRNKGHKGRGALTNTTGRFEQWSRTEVDDGWGRDDEEITAPRTTLERDASRSVISYNNSPDVPFDRSVNPYRGCEHGCIYCFARPTHAWLGLSPGLDFETRLFYKPDAAERLRAELAKPGYRCATLALGANTDPYQPVERKEQVTRSLLRVLDATSHPVGIVTKSSLVERDIDILAAMAARGLARVAVSVTTLDRSLARKMEPRATAPERRLVTITRLAEAGVPVHVLVAPVIPVVNDSEIEHILEQTRNAGALDAGYVLLRLPLEIKDLFQEWLCEHFPERAEHVMNRIRDSHAGHVYRAQFGVRMRGTGQYADLVASRFKLAHKRLNFPGMPELQTTQFRPPVVESSQLSLFS
jgi:DNA repair photolyase